MKPRIKPEILESILECIKGHGFDPANLSPEFWAAVRRNLRCLVDLEGCTLEQLARRIIGDEAPKSEVHALRVRINRILLESERLEDLLWVNHMLNHDPLLLFQSDLRSYLQSKVRQDIALNMEGPFLFDTLWVCQSCSLANSDPIAKFCKQCGLSQDKSESMQHQREFEKKYPPSVVQEVTEHYEFSQ